MLSCRRTDPLQEMYAPEEIVLDAAPGAETKGFLNVGGLTVNGTQFQMYDYLSGYNGSLTDGGGVMHEKGEEFKYFENTLTYKSDATSWKWLFGNVNSPTSYRWTRTGTHHFYGWMLKDATAGSDPDSPANRVSSSFFSTYTPGVKTLTVAKTLTIDSPQYDFLYSDVVPVDVIADGIPESVPIPMKHLFGALGITITNTSKLNVTVYSVPLKNFPSHGTATLDYDMETGVSVSNPDPTSAGTYTYWPNKITSSFTLYNINHAQAGKVYDCLTGTEITSGGQPQFRLAWPMSFNAIEPVILNETDEGITYTSSSPLIEVRYAEEGKSAGTITFRFPTLEGATTAIFAGKKTQLNLNFADKQVILSYDILPWLYKEFPMAFEDDAISATQLKFTENTFVSLPKVTDESGKHDVIQLTASSTEGAYIAKGTFKVYTPVNAKLMVTLGGNVENFEVSLDSGTTATGGNQSITIDPHRDGGLITLRIKPKGTPRSGSKCYLHFGVLNNGRDSDADTEINRDNYMIVIP